MKKTYKLICIVLSILFLLPISVYGSEHEHIMVEDFKAPTCTQEGYYNYYCSICGYSPEEAEVLPKTDHRVERWTADKSANCLNYGREHGKCLDCGALIYRSIEPNNIHRAKTIYAYPSTARSDGEVLIRCEICNQILEKTVVYRIKMIKLSKGRYEYDKKPHKPKVRAYDRAGNEISKDSFTVKYDKNSRSVGTHKAVIEFFGMYSAEAVLSYRIVPRTVSIKKLKAKKGSALIKTEKLPEEAQGYQIFYGQDKSFNKHKSITVKSRKQLEKNIKKLKSKKKYYFKVRTFSTVKDEKYYSEWSPVKSVTIK